MVSTRRLLGQLEDLKELAKFELLFLELETCGRRLTLLIVSLSCSCMIHGKVSDFRHELAYYVELSRNSCMYIYIVEF